MLDVNENIPERLPTCTPATLFVGNNPVKSNVNVVTSPSINENSFPCEPLPTILTLISNPFRLARELILTASFGNAYHEPNVDATSISEPDTQFIVVETESNIAPVKIVYLTMSTDCPFLNPSCSKSPPTHVIMFDNPFCCNVLPPVAVSTAISSSINNSQITKSPVFAFK